MSNAMVSEMQQFGTVWPQCVARAWQDTQFRETLKRDPAGTLREAYRFTVPAGISLQVVESDEVLQAQSANTLRMVIPPIPDVDMRAIALTDFEDEDEDGRSRRCYCLTAATAC